MTNRTDIERLFREHFAPMLRVALALLHDDAQARDAVHDVFAGLMERETAPELITGAYLLRAVRNRCLNHIRDCEIHRRVERLYLLDTQHIPTIGPTGRRWSVWTLPWPTFSRRRPAGWWNCVSEAGCPLRKRLQRWV